MLNYHDPFLRFRYYGSTQKVFITVFHSKWTKNSLGTWVFVMALLHKTKMPLAAALV